MKVIFEKSIETSSLVTIRKDGNNWTTEDGNQIVKTDKPMSVLGRNEYKVKMLSDIEGMVIRYTPLHNHSQYSLLDGMIKMRDFAELTEDACAITDHGNMYGFLEFYEAMTKAKKKPIIGFEAYATDLEDNLVQCHLVLLAKNEAGYKNLLKLSSESFNDENFYRKPHVTWDMLRKYHEGVIALSGCVAGLIPRYLARNDYEHAGETVERFIDIFGDDFYMEFQRHFIDSETAVMQKVIGLAHKYGVKIVATTDAHYPRKSDKDAHEVLLCIGTKSELDDPTHFSFNGTGYYLHTSEEMEELFKDVPEFLDNTLEVADKCNVEVEIGNVRMPHFDIPDGFESQKDYLWHLAQEGFKRRFGGTDKENDPEYIDRLKYEFDVICDMGFEGYFLIVQDYLDWARKHDVMVGIGRGSAAGSMLAYCLEITGLDPIQYGLLFHRFLNPSRISMPD